MNCPHGLDIRTYCVKCYHATGPHIPPREWEPHIQPARITPEKP